MTADCVAFALGEVGIILKRVCQRTGRMVGGMAGAAVAAHVPVIEIVVMQKSRTANLKQMLGAPKGTCHGIGTGSNGKRVQQRRGAAMLHKTSLKTQSACVDDFMRIREEVLGMTLYA